MTDPTDKKKKKIRVQKNTKDVNLSGIKKSKRTGKLVPKGTSSSQETKKKVLTEKMSKLPKDHPKRKALSKKMKALDREVIIQGGRQEVKAKVANKKKNQFNSESQVKDVNTRRRKLSYTVTR